MPELSSSMASRIKAHIAKLETARDRIKAKAEEKAGEMKTTLEVQGACAVSSYVVGRLEQKNGKPLEIFGVPADAAAGAVLVGAAILDLTGKYDEDALNMGNGVLAGFVARKMYAMGTRAQQKGTLFGASSIPAISGGHRVGGVASADAELAEQLRRSA